MTEDSSSKEMYGNMEHWKSATKLEQANNDLSWIDSAQKFVSMT